MTKYTIYCSEEQTKKALGLGAPIERGHESSRYFNIGVPTFFDENDEICRVKNSVIFIPTAEQTIGWLEEQGIWIHFCKPNQRPELLSFSVSNIKEPFRRVFVGGEYNSRKEATLAAIDAALDYMAHKNER